MATPEPAQRSRHGLRDRLSLALSLLRGSEDVTISGRAVVLGSVLLGAAGGLLANLIGAVAVVTLLVVVLPVPTDDADILARRNIITAAIFVGVVVLYELLRGGHIMVRRLAWLREEREPTLQERRDTLGLTTRLTAREVGWWLAAAVLFALLNAGESVVLAVEIGLTVLIGGMVTGAASYLQQERLLRPVTARALEGWPGRLPRTPGVAARTILTWAVGTGLPLIGLVLLAAIAPSQGAEPGQLALAIAVLGGIALLAGLLTMLFVARSIARPLERLEAAVIRLAEGDTSVRVTVDDSTEVGALQHGFNRMAAGLAERDRLHDLFGRHVGPEVAARALEEGVDLGGEERHVAVLFVDVIGSTQMAQELPPSDVVARLNAFFAIVVDVTHAEGGLVNKFEGDAALCIWGAPIEHPQATTAALRAARTMSEDLDGLTGLRAAVGVASGVVVAGNVGARERLEYTVIGDPVNTAARLTGEAKARQLTVLATGEAVAEAAPEEQQRWRTEGAAVLRGREEETTLLTPA